MTNTNYKTDVTKYSDLKLLINGKNYLKESSFRGAFIEERINSPFVYGKIKVDDFSDLRNQIRLDGTQNVSFTYTPLNDSPITFPNISLYKSTNITDGPYDNSKRIFYEINFSSLGYIKSAEKALSKNYNLTSPYTIYRDAFGMCGMPIETGSGSPIPISHNFVNQRLQSVISTLEDMIDTTQSRFNSCTMMTYYNRTTGGASVKLIDEILTNAPIVEEFQKYSNMVQSAGFIPTMDKNSIMFQKSFQDFDVTNRGFVNLMISTVNKGSIREYEYCPPVVINFNMGGRKIYNEMAYYDGGGPNNKKIIHQIDSINSENANLALAKKHRLVMSVHMDQNRGVFRIPPNSKIKLGVRCKLDIPKRLNDPKMSNSRGDRNSDIVLVTGITHFLDISTQNPTSYMDVEYIKPEYYGE